MGLSVAEALARVLDGVEPTAAEHIAIADAHGRTLATPLAAKLTQPPFNASAMDGYAVRAADVASLPARLRVIGEAAAGHPFAGSVAAGEAVRIFTGAPLPEGSDAVVIQENTKVAGGIVEIVAGEIDRGHVRPRGFDFTQGQELLTSGRRLGPRELSLAAAMGHGTVDVHRAPVVAILATGDELVLPGTMPGPGQIVCSNHLGVAALMRQAGAAPRLLGIARDTRASLAEHIEAAREADILITIGGASVGDHDLVGPVLKSRGMALDFWNIDMRPGKPLMYGRLGRQRVLGLPGNPVSSLICTRLFAVPLVEAMLGRLSATVLEPATTTVTLEKNSHRQHYMRAAVTAGPNGLVATPARSQDSSLLSPLASANAFIVRPPHAPALPAGAPVDIMRLDF